MICAVFRKNGGGNMRRSTSKKILYPEAARFLIDDKHLSLAQVAHAYEVSAVIVQRYLKQGRHQHQQQASKIS